jgi:hypothetical protein
VAVRQRITFVNAAVVLAVLVAVVGVAALEAGAAPTEVPKITNLKTVPATFCSKQSSTCSNPGTSIRFTVSTGARVTANVWPRFENIGGFPVFHRHFDAGARRFRFNDSRLKPGRWQLKLQGVNSVGAGTTAAITFRVVK